MRFQPRPVQALWRVRCSDGWAHCEVWTHPVGWECRVYWDGELQRSQAYRDARDAYQDADDTKARLDSYNARQGADDSGQAVGPNRRRGQNPRP